MKLRRMVKIVYAVISVHCDITGNVKTSLLNQKNFTGYAPLANSFT